MDRRRKRLVRDHGRTFVSVWTIEASNGYARYVYESGDVVVMINFSRRLQVRLK